MSKEKQIESTDWLTRGISKEQLERKKREAIMSADLQGCITYDEWSTREYGIESVDFDTTAEKMVAKGYRKQSEWISVDERLPERQGYYFGCTYKGLMMIAPFFPVYADDKPEFRYDITHWMPLPEAPMKGGGE